MANKDDDKRFKITVTGDGLSLDRETDEETARYVINILMGGPTIHTPVRSKLDGDTRPRAPSAEHAADPLNRVSLREFLDETLAQRNPDKIAVIGQYIVDYEGQNEFSREDIKDRFKHAAEAMPKNFGRDFSWTIRNGWIAEDQKSPGNHYVTKKGREAIKGKFSSEVRRATGQRPSGRRRARKRGTGDQINGNSE